MTPSINAPMHPDVGIMIQNITASWTEDGPVTLKNINISIPKGKLCAIIGSVGSGKVYISPSTLSYNFHNDHLMS